MYFELDKTLIFVHYNSRNGEKDEHWSSTKWQQCNAKMVFFEIKVVSFVCTSNNQN
jgi:hypothetical protein